MFTVQYPRLLFALPITRTPHNSNFSVSTSLEGSSYREFTVHHKYTEVTYRLIENLKLKSGYY